MDGVLVDSEELMCQAAVLMFHEKGLRVKEEDFQPFVGMGENRYLGGVAEKYGIEFNVEKDKRRAYEIYGQIARSKLKPLPGVKEFINKCRTRGLKIAVATSADEIKMKINLQEIGIPAETFDATVNGLEIEKKKPFPDIYLKAAERLGVEPTSCLVVEDAISGEKAAKSAGCRVLAITSSFPPEAFEKADWKAKNLFTAPIECLTW